MNVSRPRVWLEVIVFDADDTLWHNEHLFQDTQRRLSELLAPYGTHAEVQAELAVRERRNVRLFGYGIKGFILSMVETAIDMSDREISAAEIYEIVTLGRAMMEAPLQLMDGVEAVLQALHDRHRLLLITKGDLFHQRNKIEKSGLGRYFEHTEVVTDKDAATYRQVFVARGVAPERAMMVGNSVPSDILPVLELGGYAVHIPYAATAEFERHDGELAHPRLYTLQAVTELPALLRRI